MVGPGGIWGRVHGVGSDHWGIAIPELDSIADAREARFLGEYVLKQSL